MNDIASSETVATVAPASAEIPRRLPVELTYGQLISIHLGGREEVQKKTAQNEVSLLRKFMELLSYQDGDDVTWMSSEVALRARLRGLRKAHPADDKFHKTLKSSLKNLRDTLMATLPPQDENIFKAYIRAVREFKNNGGKAKRMSHTKFFKYCFGYVPTPEKREQTKIGVQAKTYETIRNLELSLKADGVLTNWLYHRGHKNKERYRTRQSRKSSEAAQFDYGFPFNEWPPHLRQEWDDLFLLRTEPIKAKRKWDLTLNTDLMQRAIWTTREDQGLNFSAAKQQQELITFFGWCLLPPVHKADGKINLWRSGPPLDVKDEKTPPQVPVDSTGAETPIPEPKKNPERRFEPKDISLALITDLDLFDAYLEFRKAHTLLESEYMAGKTGMFNMSCKTFVELTMSLVNTDTGFIYHRSDLYFQPNQEKPSPANIAPRVGRKFVLPGQLLPTEIANDHERWFHYCKKIHSYMRSTQKTNFKRSKKSRELEPIKSILELNNPLEALTYLRQKLAEEEHAVQWMTNQGNRKKLFFDLIINCPLRILQFGIMTGKHLVKKEPRDSKRTKPFYQIRFTKAEFKNMRFIPDRDFIFDLPDEMTKQIDDFLKKDWPAITGRAFKPEDHIFESEPPSKGNKGKRSITLRIKHQLTKICYETTGRILGEKYKTPGFGPHAFRHIIATATIKNTGSLELAALLLWDALVTVEQAYGHIKREDRLRDAAEGHFARLALTSKLTRNT